MKRIFVHVLCDLLVISLAIGIPVLLSGRRNDAVSSASVVAAPSGEFVILLNLDALTEEAFWTDFFGGREVDFCFEDITCMVGANDIAALQMAQSLQSRLSERQFTIRQEDMTLMLSKADHGKFQVMILSKELAEQYHADSAIHGNVKALHTGQEAAS